MTSQKKLKIDINKLFSDEQTDFLDSLNDHIRNGLTVASLQVLKFEEISTTFGPSLRIEVEDNDNEKQYSFLCSGKIFRKLFEENVEVGDNIKIYLNEKNHWRFDFVK